MEAAVTDGRDWKKAPGNFTEDMRAITELYANFEKPGIAKFLT
jgi:hypothetical protein